MWGGIGPGEARGRDGASLATQGSACVLMECPVMFVSPVCREAAGKPYKCKLLKYR